MKPILLLLFSFLSLNSSYSQEKKAPEYVTYYFVELIPNTEKTDFTAEELREIQTKHLRNIRKMVSDGLLLLAGPFPETGGGLFILKTKSIDEAENLVMIDPAVKAGRFKYEIKTWITQKGLLALEDGIND
ncbi:YciI family protein [Ichthyenterobacterium magnum]|uniref:Uncharacterized protein YciI n=1 Tax=Ichthyenterobacterium magnum TaxID=1230530 RepID=A0A420DEJ8_9FLAO|nr:YciI family protein [Ichthyenterobacterium magnum]RKE90800.1 uncharacterized protein YciI [Ichthyenterobacterium magnum]